MSKPEEQRRLVLAVQATVEIEPADECEAVILKGCLACHLLPIGCFDSFKTGNVLRRKAKLFKLVNIHGRWGMDVKFHRHFSSSAVETQ
jgi:hypothetical protein